LTTNLAAWASALIEIDGMKPVEYLEEHYCQRSDRTLDELGEVFKAFALHGTEDTVELRDRIITACHVLLQTHPAMSELVSRDMRVWNRSDPGDSPQTMESSRKPSSSVRHDNGITQAID
jgi:hypothetical protein